MRKWLLISLTLLLIGLSVVAYVKKKQLEQVKEAPDSSSQSQRQETSASSNHEKASLTSQPESSRTEQLTPFIGNWKLDIQGVEGHQLIIAAEKFQYYLLYNGHAIPANERNVTYQFSDDSQTLTLSGERPSSDALRGERLAEDWSRDTIVVTLIGSDQLLVVVDDQEIQLSDGQKNFIRTDKIPSIVELPS